MTPIPIDAFHTKNYVFKGVRHVNFWLKSTDTLLGPTASSAVGNDGNSGGQWALNTGQPVHMVN